MAVPDTIKEVIEQQIASLENEIARLKNLRDHLYVEGFLEEDIRDSVSFLITVLRKERTIRNNLNDRGHYSGEW